MGWQERLIEAAYTSPQGTRFTFSYEDVSRQRDKQTSAFNFSDADGTFIQDLGVTGRRFPFRMFFSGDNHDVEADAFELSLGERGNGQLEHPRYGVVTVVPTGTINQRDDLKTAANQTVIEVAFWETIESLFPIGQQDFSSAILEAIEDSNEQSAQTFFDSINIDSKGDEVSLKERYNGLVTITKNTLNAVANATDEVRSVFNAVFDSINTGIDTFIAEPLSLARQTQILIQAPARSVASIVDRLDAYKSLADGLVNATGSIRTASISQQPNNDFHTDDLFVGNVIIGQVSSVLNNQFSTKPDAINAADSVLVQFEAWQQWRDDNFQSLQQTDTGESYDAVNTAVSLTVGFLVDLSFSLNQERRLVLDRARNLVELSAELYGNLDNVEFFISSNALTGDEIKELPKGKTVVYYVGAAS